MKTNGIVERQREATHLRTEMMFALLVLNVM